MGFGRCWCPGHPAVLSPQQALWEEAGPPRGSHADPEGAALGSPGTRGRGRDGATPGPPCCGVAPSPDHSPLATPQGPSEAVATVKPVTGGGYQPRAPTGRPAATRPPGITGGFGAEGGGISSSPIALGGWERGQLCSILMESCCARLNPLCAPPPPCLSFPGWRGAAGDMRGAFATPLQSPCPGSSPPRRSRSRPSSTSPAARTSTPTATCRGKCTSARRCGVGGGQGDVERAAASAPCPLRAGTGLVWGGRVDGGGFCAAVPSWQVFYPKESCNDPLLLDLIFRQVRC